MFLLVDLFVCFLFVLCPSFVIFCFFTTSASDGPENGTADNSESDRVVDGQQKQNSAVVGAVPSPSAAVPVVNRSPVAAAFCEAIVQTEQQQKATGTQNREMAIDESEKSTQQNKFLVKLLFTLAKSGGVARMRAILSGCDADELKRLLEAEENGATLLDVAAQNDKTEVAKLLLEKGAIGPTDGTDSSVTIQFVTMSKHSPFWAVLLKEQTKLVEIMLNNGQNPNEHVTFMCDEIKQTISPLHFAAQMGNLELCKLLVAKGAKVNQRSKDKRGIVPLHIACARGHLTIVKFFLERGGADIEVADSDGDTALIYALLENKLDIVHYLIARGARADRTNKMGVSPLHIVVKMGDFALCKFFVENGVNVNQKTTNDTGHQLTPLHLACADGHLQIVKLLVEEGNADIEVADSDGDTAFLCALLENKLDIGGYLITRGARIDRTNKFGISPLHIFAKKGDFALCKFLVENGANVNQKTTVSSQVTPLLIACAEGHLQIVKLLVEEGNADIEVADSDGDTPLILALMKHNFKIARYLCDKGARTDRPNNAGLTPHRLIGILGIGLLLSAAANDNSDDDD
ncbi:hypothetical protein niasHS_012362 [Heterodera schachtii]|uniref:ANK_REP_REGION domain-containing protein n=1 Tax=Heterodera schachtii TaxID=97005 RepID=A0ABD2J509_HETSC